MSDTQAIVECPACGSRNKPSWEFCVRCGEALLGADSGTLAPARPTISPEDAAPAADSSPTGGPSFGALAASAAAVVGAAILWQSGWAKKDPPRPAAAAVAMSARGPQYPPAPPYSSATLKFMQAKQRMAAGDTTTAFTLFQEAIAEEPQNAQFHVGYGEALSHAGRADEAVTHMRNGARLEPLTYQATFARFLYIAGHAEESMREYDTLTNLVPADIASAREFAAILGQARQYGRAAEVLRRAAQNSPGNLVVRTELAHALQTAGDSAGAEDAYREILSADPVNAPALARLGELLTTQGKTQQTVDLFRAALNRAPDAAPIHLRLGQALEKNGDLKEAATHYREFARLRPNEPEAAGLAQRAAMIEARLGQRS